MLHAHTLQEEWIYVLGGRGQVQLGDAAVEIEAGDFVGFPTDGTPHVVQSAGTHIVRSTSALTDADPSANPARHRHASFAAQSSSVTHG